MSEIVEIQVQGKKAILDFVGADLLLNILESITPATIKDINQLGGVMRKIKAFTDRAQELITGVTDIGVARKKLKDFEPLDLNLTEEQFKRIREKISLAFDQKQAVMLAGKLEEVENFLAQFDLTE